MSWFCKHDWKKIKETYAKSCYENGQTPKHSPLTYLEKILHFGLTTILWECSKCYGMRKEEMLGKEV